MLLWGDDMALRTNKTDMVEGPLWGKILKFALFYMMTAFLQKLYSAADVAVVGKFAGADALAGVGTCTVVINLFLNFILGLSAGGTIVIGQAIGAGEREGISKSAHTAIAVAICGGAIISAVCLIFTRSLLSMVDVPEKVLPHALTYFCVIAIGFVPALVYNFGAAILRAKGDTKRPLYIVSVSGIINVGLNLLFVCVFKMEAGGVALATIISQVFTAVSVLYILSNEEDETRIIFKNVRVYKEPFIKMIRFGLPSAIQSSVFSSANVIVQSRVNAFGAAATAGCAAVNSITEFYSEMCSSFYHSSLVFISQNFGAKKFDRIKKTISICFVYMAAVWALQSVLTFFFGENLIRIYTDDASAIEMGLCKFSVVGFSYGIMGFMTIMSGALRGMGASFFNMVSTIIGVCGIRIVWIFTAFKAFNTIEALYVCYPLSWAGTLIFHSLMFMFVYKKAKKRVGIIQQ